MHPLRFFPPPALAVGACGGQPATIMAVPVPSQPAHVQSATAGAGTPRCSLQLCCTWRPRQALPLSSEQAQSPTCLLAKGAWHPGQAMPRHPLLPRGGGGHRGGHSKEPRMVFPFVHNIRTAMGLAHASPGLPSALFVGHTRCLVAADLFLLPIAVDALAFVMRRKRSHISQRK